MELSKAIERCKELIKSEHDRWIGLTNQEAIETVLQSLEKLQDENEKLREIDFTTLYMMGVSDGKTKLENKIKKKIEEIGEAEKTYALDFNIGRKFLEELLKGE